MFQILSCEATKSTKKVFSLNFNYPYHIIPDAMYYLFPNQSFLQQGDPSHHRGNEVKKQEHQGDTSQEFDEQ